MNSKQKGARGEQWKDIAGHEGLYQVSDWGRIKSFPKYNYKTVRILKTNTNVKNSRISIMLCKNPNDRKRLSVHRLVASAFVENPNNYLEINHKDENPRNNYADNLEWCTRKYNMNYGTTPQRLNIKNRKRVVGENQEIKISYGAIRWGKKDGYDSSGILYSIRTKRTYKGLYWRYADDN